MATLLLSAAGAAVGGSLGGTALGIGAAAIGKAVGASVGSVIDQRLLGTGSQTVRGRRVDRFRVQGASEGLGIARVFGRMRVPAQVIWSSNFREQRSSSTTGSKGATRTTVEYTYSVSLALALCEGQITRIGRVWADGNLVNVQKVEHRIYYGTETQQPDMLIEAIEGSGRVPAYRGLAYVVIEDLELAAFGNRIPQFNVEVIRHTPEVVPDGRPDPFRELKGVALVPGSGEYALATTPVTLDIDKGVSRKANVNNGEGTPDINVALKHLKAEMPQVDRASLVVSWFGDDLRCGQCQIRPAVEQRDTDGTEMPWSVSGVTRYSAFQVSHLEGRPAFGGTPTDASVVQAIERMRTMGIGVMFYPFLLMDIIKDSGKPDPWSLSESQPEYPWRGRITLDNAPGQAGTADKTATARQDVRRFFGNAVPSDFWLDGQNVLYSGPLDWSYRRFILHNAYLCKAAGGVSAFCIGSEMRALTQIRDETGAFPAVKELKRLAADVRGILGAGTKIGYAADWSEYFGYRPGDGSGDVLFHLDPLWASADIDFIGIDNYMPLSDWRDENNHLDIEAGSIHSLEYLTSNVAGGEGYDWYYADATARTLQDRTPIADTAHGEDWIFRYKDLENWWRNRHFDRPGGIRAAAPTEWVPFSKPFWFTELGCGAIDKGTNQPNVFLDPKSSESFEPYFSSGSPDYFIQYRYFQAHLAHWNDPQNNPVSPVYGQTMVDTDNIFVWAWDTRPWPDFPVREAIWSDGGNYRRGHWISGRTSLAVLSSVVSEIAERAGVACYDVSDLHGAVSGYLVAGPETGRQSLEPLMLSHAFDARETGSSLEFRNRSGRPQAVIATDDLAIGEAEPDIEVTRAAEAEIPGRVQITYYDAENDYQIGAGMGAKPGVSTPDLAETDLPIAIDQATARSIARRWIAESDVSRDTARFALPPSSARLIPGDVVEVTGDTQNARYRIDRLEDAGERAIDSVRVDPSVYWSAPFDGEVGFPYRPPQPGGFYADFLDLPLITGDEIPHSPFIAATASPWTGTASVYVSSDGNKYEFNRTIPAPSIVGTTVSRFEGARAGLWQCADEVFVRVPRGELHPATAEEVLDGANIAAIRAGTPDWEIFQFQEAQLVDTNEYRLSGFLRGQFGTEHMIPPHYDPGADFVLLDGSAVQPDLLFNNYDALRHYKIGPSSQSPDSSLYIDQSHRATGVGFRPYSPSHLRAFVASSGDIELDWVRRTRVGGDNWSALEVPLGEDRESYLVRVISNSKIVHEAQVSAPNYTYSAAQQSIDAAAAPLTIDVAQISDLFGFGPFTRIQVDG